MYGQGRMQHARCTYMAGEAYVWRMEMHFGKNMIPTRVTSTQYPVPSVLELLDAQQQNQKGKHCRRSRPSAAPTPTSTTATPTQLLVENANRKARKMKRTQTHQIKNDIKN